MRIISLISILLILANHSSRAEDVTPEMEQAFLVKYKAALDKKDIEAYRSLICDDPGLDANMKEESKELTQMALAFDVSSPNRTYTFIPVPNGQHNPPTWYDGKTYVGYLPAVIALKITFAKPASASPNEGGISDITKPLCIKDHQLMITGVKEEVGAPIKSDEIVLGNCGIIPNAQKITVDTKTELDANLRFASLDDFLNALKLPRLEILDSGEIDVAYYAICRIEPDSYVYVSSCRDKEYTCGKFHLLDSKSKQLNDTDADMEDNSFRIMDQERHFKNRDSGKEEIATRSLMGNVFEMAYDYSGPLTLKVEYWDKSGTVSTLSRTVNWQ